MEHAASGDFDSPFGSEYPTKRVNGLVFSGRLQRLDEFKPLYSYRLRLIGISFCILFAILMGMLLQLDIPARLKELLSNFGAVPIVLAFHFFLGGYRSEIRSLDPRAEPAKIGLAPEPPREGLNQVKLTYWPDFWTCALRDEGWAWVENDRLLYRGEATCFALGRDRIGQLYPDGEWVTLHLQPAGGKRLGKIRLEITTPTANPYKKSYALFAAIQGMNHSTQVDILPTVETATVFSQKRFREDALCALLSGAAIGILGITGKDGLRLEKFDPARDRQVLLFWPLALIALVLIAHGYQWLSHRNQYKFGIRAAEEPRG